MKKVKLFCIPHAGGSATTYLKWKKYLHHSIDLVPLELSGRGNRMGSSFYETIDEAVDDLYHRIRYEINDYRYTFYGHSMGSIIAYELTHKLIELNFKRPDHIFFSGREAPQINKGKCIHLSPETGFREEILKIGGTPKEIFEHDELRRLYLPVLRADFKIHENYVYVPKNQIFDFDITVLSGKDDQELTPDDLAGWRIHTSANCAICMIDGGHMFIVENVETVTDIINSVLV